MRLKYAVNIKTHFFVDFLYVLTGIYFSFPFTQDKPFKYANNHIVVKFKAIIAISALDFGYIFNINKL